ncbi:UBC-like protein [Pholiota conissans]|uniref:UBC-like protein n=1 Tax=Pholiota conissans TaxID=109636 RepID=A0A9P5ZD78_9AGAR|nr:UBC-like protein [Pholiota conissans]
MALNKNNSAVKRIMQEARELANDPCTDYCAAPLEEWHCTLRGSAGTEFEGGLYHFRILLPAEYPFRPPSIMILTPNGRFELNTKICISFTSYHEELWQPAWGVRTAIIGLQGFFPLKGQAAVGVGSIEYPASERKRLAALSREWVCPHCQHTNLELLPDPPTQEQTATPSTSEEKPTTLIQTDTLQSPNVVSAEVSLATISASSLDTKISDDASGTTLTSTPSDLSNNHMTEESAHLDHSDATSTHDSESSAPSSAQISLLSHPTPTTPSQAPIAQVQMSSRRSQKPPMLLDGAICILLVLLFAIVCRRIV